MSQLAQSLEKRIQELTASIEAQKIELAAYQHVLRMETSKGGSSPEETSHAHEALLQASIKRTAASKKPAAKKATPSKKKVARPDTSANGHEPSSTPADLSNVPFTGNKTTLVAEIVKGYGSAGATPKDVDAFFTKRNVERSKNLIYNTLSYLVAQNKLQRREGKNFAVSINPVGAPPAKKTAADSATKKTTTKRRLSPEGLKRIKEALKKRWAAAKKK